MVDQIIDRRTVAIPGPMGDVTAAALNARNAAQAAAAEAEASSSDAAARAGDAQESAEAAAASAASVTPQGIADLISNESQPPHGAVEGVVNAVINARIQADRTIVPSSGSNPRAEQAVTFRTPFTSVPRVVCDSQNVVGGIGVIAKADSVTTTGFTIYAVRSDGQPLAGDTAISWIAVGEA